MKKIDIFNHIWTTRFYSKLREVTGKMTDITRRSEAVPMMTDLDERFRIMDRFGDYQQILSLASPPLEIVASPAQQQMLSRVGSEDMAELCDKHPDRFPGYIASIPMGHPETVLEETRHAMEKLGAAGVQVFSNVKGKNPFKDKRVRGASLEGHGLARPQPAPLRSARSPRASP